MVSEIKTAVVTGGSKGIGQALVQLFLQQGFQVFTCARSEEGLQKLRDMQPHKQLFTRSADFAQPDQVIDFCQWVLQHTKQIDVLVNNAGIFLPGQILTEEENTFEQLIQVNLASAYHITRQLAPLMKKRGVGHIFNMCSTASFTPYINGGSYCISKFGLYGLSKVLREELKTFGVKVTAVLPGATYTSSWEGAGIPIERFIPANDIAMAVWQAYNMSPSTVIEDLIIRPQLGDIV